METPKPRTKVEAMAWFMAYHRAPTSADLKHAADDLEELHQRSVGRSCHWTRSRGCVLVSQPTVNAVIRCRKQ